MNCFLKITRGELDKIFIRPAIFIMTGFFVLAIVMSILMFNPKEREDLYDLTNISGNTVVEVYNNFNSNQHKLIYDNDLTQIKNNLNYYKGTDDNNLYKKDLDQLLTNIINSFNNYELNVNSYEGGNIDNIIECKNDLKESISIAINSYNTLNQKFVMFYITKSNNENLQNKLNQLNNEVATSGDINDIEHHKRIINAIKSQNYFNDLNAMFDKIIPVEVSLETVNNLENNFINECDIRLDNISNEMLKFYTSASVDEAFNNNDKFIKEMKTYADNYKLTIIQLKNIVYDTTLLEIVGNKSHNELQKYTSIELNNSNKYQLKEDLSKNEYLFENSLFNYQFSNVFQSNINSNEKTNAYDFMYYALEFLSFVIIIFCVIIGAGMISSETSSGTMKLLAIRPYKRHKIITGKLTATFLIGIIFLIIGTITTFIIGARLYGVDSKPILYTFNAEFTSVMSAFELFLIFLLLLLVRIVVYTSLAVFISTVFKSNIAAVVISVVIYIFVALFGNLFGNSLVYAYLPFANVDLFRFLGGDFIASNGNVLGLDFSCPIQSDTNFYISLTITGIFIAILLSLTYIIFNKRDIE